VNGRSVIDHFSYLLLLGGCVLITLPLEFLLRARVYRRWRALLAAVLPVVIIFSAWDVLAIYRDHWSYDARFVTGIRLVAGLPLEELIFFAVIPTCGLLSYEAVGALLAMIKRRRQEARRA